MNKLILGDCLEVLQKLEPESIDLIYIDPPFFSNRTYEVIWGDKGEVRSFEDRFSGGIDHYISWLKERVQAMHQLLKPTGSIFVHCDWHANAYIRVHILDKIFGNNNFINEITWQRATTHNDTKQGAKHFGRVTDTIFLYAKDNKQYIFNPQHERYTSEYIAQAYNKADENGRRFKASDLSAAKGGGDTSYEWKGKKPPKGRYWAYSKANLEEFEKQDKIYYSNTGRPYLKHYLDEMPGTSVDSLWFNCVFRTKKERIGYPTQKPEALIERIVKCATNEGDTVLDCFMGGGTTIAVADKLNRKWIGIDQSVNAVKVTEFRLNTQQGLFSKPFTLTLHKYDYDTLRYKDAFEFESWIVGQFGGIANTKQRGDLGIDGRTKENQAIQVKRSDNIGREIIDKFKSACERFDKTSYEKHKAEQKPVGFIIAFSFGKGAIQEIGRLKNEENIVIKLVTVEEIVPIAKKPALEIEMIDKGLKKDLREIEFIATAKSETGIEFYSWDFEFNETQFLPQILRDTEGKQSYQFKGGEHKIAVKVVDGEGLESIEIVKLKVNGDIKRK
jgi:DNA modification methylase